MNTEFRSTKTIGFLTGIFLLSGIAVDGVVLVLELLQRAYFPGVWTSDADYSDGEAIFVLGFLAVLLVSLLLFVSTVITFLIWIHRSYSNLVALNVQSLSSTPGWAVGYWFIPILCLFKPLKIVNELYHSSDPSVEQDSTRFSFDSTTVIHGFWWALWVIGSIAGNVSFRMSLQAESPAAVEAASVVDLILLPLWMVCGGLAYLVVKEITSRQERILEQMDIGLPPEPPTFGSGPNADF